MRSQSRRLFFSSRRRHTRSYGDWSSDVCSSDLNGGPVAHAERIKTFLALHGLDPAERRTLTIGFASGRFPFINIPYGIVPRNPVEAEIGRASCRATVCSGRGGASCNKSMGVESP